jgi:hypothetical protein
MRFVLNSGLGELSDTFVGNDSVDACFNLGGSASNDENSNKNLRETTEQVNNAMSTSQIAVRERTRDRAARSEMAPLVRLAPTQAAIQTKDSPTNEAKQTLNDDQPISTSDPD